MIGLFFYVYSLRLSYDILLEFIELLQYLYIVFLRYSLIKHKTYIFNVFGMLNVVYWTEML